MKSPEPEKPVRVLAVIPARGGSKSIPHKNIANLCGHPLIYYSIREAHAARLES
jgi:CMP-N-acetylneuraminic acid synthetase